VLEDGAINVEHKEYAFFLFRHWSLFESMYHSRRVAVKLSTWTASGKNKLHLILEKLGIPLKESNATYNFMDQSPCWKPSYTL
jgi:cell division control protein 45